MSNILKNKCSPGSLLLLPAGLLLFVFMILPLLILLVYSLGTRDPAGRIVLGLNFGNYLRFFSGPYLLCLWRSLCLATATTAVCLVLGYASSLWLAFNACRRRRNIYLILLVAPLWTAFLLRIYAWITILRPTGLLSHLLCHLGMCNPPVILYSQAAVLIGMVYNYLPYMILPLYACLEKLDTRLLEAAADLGASPWRAFAAVTVPLSARGVVAGITMVFVPALGDYITPDLLGGAKTMLIGNLIQNQFLVVRNWAFASAVSTILIVIVALAIWIYLKFGDTSEPARQHA